MDDDEVIRLVRLSDMEECETEYTEIPPEDVSVARGGASRPYSEITAPGGWCAPVYPMYDLFTIQFRFCTSWDRDWNAIVAPRFTAMQRWVQGRWAAVRRAWAWRPRRRCECDGRDDDWYG